MEKYTLGLATMGTSSAALFKGGKLICAVEEERLSRIKNDGNFPHKSIEEVLSIAKINARLFQLMPKPLLTVDQLTLLKYDNVISKEYKNNFDLKLDANKKFDDEINRYSFNWTTGGQFSKKRLDKTN